MRRKLVLALVCSCLLVACSTPPPVKAPLQAQTRFVKLAPPASVGRYQLQPGQVAIAPVLQHQVLPIFPPHWVHADAPPVTVIARIVIGREGKVTAVEPVIKGKASPRYARFVAAVKSAVKQWHFYPYRVQTPQQDGTVSQVAMPVTLWYVFHFTVAHGKPVVRAGRR